MRDWERIDGYLDMLNSDVYEQPEDDGHTALARRMINWMKVPDCQSVLDVGCGTGFCQTFFQNKKINYTGVCLGRDVQEGQDAGNNILEMDYNFLNFPDNSFDLIFSRHSLEHSPFPIFTLLEWHRVGSKYLAVVMPNPNKYTFVGRNHYSVSNPKQIIWWMRRAGWKLIQVRLFEAEFWFVCQKMPIISYEGWASVPLDPRIHEFERDLLNIDIDTDKCYKGV